MNTVFNDLEAARIAVEIEKNGAHFYRTAEKIVQDPAMKEELRKLAEQEDGHARSFAQLAEELEREKEDWAPYSTEANLFLSALASSVVFPGGALAQAMQGRMNSMEEILKSAIRSEMDSIAFYRQILAESPDASFVSGIETIIHDETQHLQELTDRLEQNTKEK